MRSPRYRSFVTGMLMLERARLVRAGAVVRLLAAALLIVPLLDMIPLVVLGVDDVLLPLMLLTLMPVPLVALVSRGVLLLPLDIPDELPLVPVVVLLPLAFARLRSTSPPDVLLVPLRCIVPLAGMQLVVLAPFEAVVLVPVPVPLAPFVVFNPVMR